MTMPSAMAIFCPMVGAIQCDAGAITGGPLFGIVDSESGS